MPTPTTTPVLTTTRDPVRRIFHALLALGGWILFVYTWWVVFRPGLDRGALWIFAGIAVTFAVIVLANQLWVLHNLSIFRTRPRRTQIRPVDFFVSSDVLGRSLEADWSALRGASRILVDIPAEDLKVYSVGGTNDAESGTVILPSSPRHSMSHPEAADPQRNPRAREETE